MSCLYSLGSLEYSTVRQKNYNMPSLFQCKMRASLQCKMRASLPINQQTWHIKMFLFKLSLIFFSYGSYRLVINEALWRLKPAPNLSRMNRLDKLNSENFKTPCCRINSSIKIFPVKLPLIFKMLWSNPPSQKQVRTIKCSVLSLKSW